MNSIYIYIYIIVFVFILLDSTIPGLKEFIFHIDFWDFKYNFQKSRFSKIYFNYCRRGKGTTILSCLNLQKSMKVTVLGSNILDKIEHLVCYYKL